MSANKVEAGARGEHREDDDDEDDMTRSSSVRDREREREIERERVRIKVPISTCRTGITRGHQEQQHARASIKKQRHQVVQFRVRVISDRAILSPNIVQC